MVMFKGECFNGLKFVFEMFDFLVVLFGRLAGVFFLDFGFVFVYKLFVVFVEFFFGC